MSNFRTIQRFWVGEDSRPIGKQGFRRVSVNGLRPDSGRPKIGRGVVPKQRSPP
jgi:hypothetical protein